MENKRIDYRFKLLYAIGIIQIVCGHCQGGGISLEVSDWFPYAGLHVALFPFCSGYLYNNESANNIPDYILKKSKSLLFRCTATPWFTG